MTKQIHKNRHRKPVTCKDCGKYAGCLETDRMYPCTAFRRRKRRKLSDTAWDMIGACMVVLLAPMMVIAFNIVRCFI